MFLDAQPFKLTQHCETRINQTSRKSLGSYRRNLINVQSLAKKTTTKNKKTLTNELH